MTPKTTNHVDWIISSICFSLLLSALLTGKEVENTKKLKPIYRKQYHRNKEDLSQKATKLYLLAYAWRIDKPKKSLQFIKRAEKQLRYCEHDCQRLKQRISNLKKQMDEK